MLRRFVRDYPFTLVFVAFGVCVVGMTVLWGEVADFNLSNWASFALGAATGVGIVRGVALDRRAQQTKTEWE